MLLDQGEKVHRGLTILMGVVFATTYSIPISAQSRTPTASELPTTENLATSRTGQPVRAFGGQLAVFLGHEGEVNSAEFSPNGQQILTASRDKTARLWDNKGNLLAVLDGHEDWIRRAVFSSDGRQILTASGDKTARLWDSKGNLLAVLRGHESFVNNAEFSPNGQQILTASNDSTARLWDSKGNLLAVLQGHEEEINSAVFSPNGRYILTASDDNTARLWDRQGNLLAVLRGHRGTINSAKFSPDGRHIVTAGWDDTALLWDSKGNLLTELLGNDNVVYSSAEFSPDSQQILTASKNNNARLWDSKGNLLVLLGEDGVLGYSAEFSPNGQQILTASNDNIGRLWDSKGNLLAILRGHGNLVTSVKFSPDGRHILTASNDKTARLWDVSDAIAAQSEQMSALQAFKEGVSKNNAQLAVLRGHEDSVTSAKFSPDGQQILTASWDKTARLWDRQGNLLAVLQGHGEEVNSAVFSPDGRQILTCDDNTARLWDSQGNLLNVLGGHEHGVNSAEFSPDGRHILTAGWDNTARLWDSQGNLLTVWRGHEQQVNSAEFSPDGQHILTISADKTARLWDRQGNFLAVLWGYEYLAYSAEFSPNGQYILTTSEDKTAQLWDRQGNLLAVLRGHKILSYSAEFSPNGQYILTTSEDKTAQLWDVSDAIAAQSEQMTALQASQVDVSENNAPQAAAAFQEGIQLSQQGTVESRQLAIQKLQESLKLYHADKNLAKEAQTLLLIGNIYANLGQFQNALDYYNQALSLSRQAGAKAEEAAILNSLGQLYNDLADPKTALDYYNQALPFLYQLNDEGGAAITFNNIGDIHAATGKWEKALESYNKGLIISRPISNLATEATALTGIGSTYIASQDWTTALNAYDQALKISRHLNDKIKQTTILNQLGKINAALGQNSTAIEHYNQALSLSQQLGYKTEEAHILYNQAILNRQQNNLTDAKTEIETAIHIIESLRTQIASQELRQSYFARNQDYYQFYIDLLMQLHQQNPLQGYDGEALHISERARARSLIELLTEATANIRSGADPKLLEQERNLQQQLNAFEHRKYQLQSGQFTEQELNEIKQKIDNTLAELNKVEAHIRASSPRYADLKYPEPLNLQQIQQQVLDDDTLLLEYSLGQDRSYLWAVTKNSINSFVLPKQSEIEAAVETFRESVTQDSAATIDTGLPLSQMLLSPVANQLGNKRLLIVGDGALQYVPFAALPIPDSPTNPLLVQNEIVTLPSISTVAIQRRQLQNRSPVAKTVAVIADPVFSLKDDRITGNPPAQNSDTLSNRNLNRAARNLLGLGEDGGGQIFDRLQFTRTEANKILALVPETQHLQAFDFNASRQTATNPDLSQYQIIHFATHGLLDPINPELSGIVLSLYDQKGNPEDGFLRLHDIFNLNLPAELVVLSACETGLGENVKGEGLVGLTRGFMYAGSRRVVVSLWSVNDVATSELMAKFYHKMLQGKQNPTTALREAQLEMWTSQQWQSPYYWAAFTVQGDWQ